MKKKALFLLALAGCRTPAELGPRLAPIRRPRELVNHLASRASAVKAIYLRGGLRYSGPVGPRRRRAHLQAKIFLGSQGNVRLMANFPVLDRRIADVLVADGEFQAYVPAAKKLYRGKTEGVFPKGKGRPGLPPGVGGKWFFFPDFSLASGEQMSVSRGKRYYDVAVMRGDRPARSFRVSAWSRIPEEVQVYDLDKPGEILAAIRYTSFRLEGKRLLPRTLEVRFPGLEATAALRIDKLIFKENLPPGIWRLPRVRKDTEVVELKPEAKDG